MLASITPLGERGRSRRWSVSAPAYVVGSVLGGLAVGALAGSLGALMVSDVGTTPRLVVLAVALAFGLLLDLRVGGLRPPGPKRQVNEDWLELYREWVYGAGFGLQLGAAVLTQIPTAATWVMLLAAGLSGALSTGLLVGGVFGLVRALPVLLTSRVHDAASLRRLHVRSAALARPAALTTVGALGLTGAAVTGLLLTGGLL